MILYKKLAKWRNGVEMVEKSLLNTSPRHMPTGTKTFKKVIYHVKSDLPDGYWARVPNLMFMSRTGSFLTFKRLIFIFDHFTHLWRKFLSCLHFLIIG